MTCLPLSVVIPVYNSAQTLELLFSRLAHVLGELAPTYEIIFVNDASRDDSWSILRRLAAAHPQVTIIDLMRNFGQHNALLCGIREARYPIIVTMDDDLQHPPEEIGKLLAKLDDGVDVVYGVPKKQEHGVLRVFASMLIKRALKASMRVDVARDVQPFRAFRTDLRQAFATHSASDVSIDVLLSWGTSRFCRVVVDHCARQHGKSNYNLSRLISHAFNMITGYSTAPLRAASLVGLCLAIFGALLLIAVIIAHFLTPNAPPGFAFLASALSIFSGAQLFFLGIIGEYLGRVHSRVMDRPPYLVRERITCETDSLNR